MKALLIAIILLLPGISQAAVFVCTVPTAGETRMGQVCEVLRKQLHSRSADWSGHICASYLMAIGLEQVHAEKARNNAHETVRDAEGQARRDFRADHPSPVTKAFCGDGTTDTEYGEQCDDGNNDPNDTCRDCRDNP